MASVQEPCTVAFYAKEPSGNKHLLFSSDVTVLATGGGAPDAAATSTTKMNERLFVQRVDRVTLLNDWILEVEVTAVGADGIDVSDSIWSIPITVQGKGVKYLSQADFANPAAADWTTVAGIPTVAAGYKITEGRVRFGGGAIYCDIQDDT